MQIDCFNDLNKQVKISSQTQNAYLENKLLYFENYAKNFQKIKCKSDDVLSCSKPCNVLQLSQTKSWSPDDARKALCDPASHYLSDFLSC